MCFIKEEIFDILAEIGYEYDSSIHSAIVPGKYLNWQKPMKPYFIKAKNRSCERKYILEIPISAVPFFRVPISWWWMRNLGSWLTYLGAQMNLLLNNNVVLYFHPWEYADLPIIKGILVHYVNRCGKDFLGRLGKFIKCYIRKYNFTVLGNLSELYYKNSNFENSQSIPQSPRIPNFNKYF